MELTTHLSALPPMSEDAITKVNALQDRVLTAQQVPIFTSHVLHGGMYLRSIRLPKGAALVGALIKKATALIISGDVTVFKGETEERITGYRVLPGSAGRKQAFIAHDDTCMTMVFPTHARTVEEAEVEFTDDHKQLMSRTGDNEIFIGELP